MEPSQTGKDINESQLSIHHLNKVTTVSKYLALTCFVILPFLGGWIGYQYGENKLALEQVPLTSLPTSTDVLPEIQEKSVIPPAGFTLIDTPESTDAQSEQNIYVTGVYIDTSMGCTKLDEVAAEALYSKNIANVENLSALIPNASAIIEGLSCYFGGGGYNYFLQSTEGVSQVIRYETSECGNLPVTDCDGSGRAEILITNTATTTPENENSSSGLYIIDGNAQQVFYPSHTQGDSETVKPIQRIAIPNVDFSTFTVINNNPPFTYYAKDVNRVYFLDSDLWSGEVTFTELPNADPDTFIHPLDNDGGNTYLNYYALDKNQVYYRGDVVKDADPETFKLIDAVRITMDSNTVFYWQKPILGADPLSFKVLVEINGGNVYSQDKNNFYVNECVVSDVDSKTLQALNTYQDIFTDKTGTFTIKTKSGKKRPTDCSDFIVSRT